MSDSAEPGRLPDKFTTRRIISDYFLEHRDKIIPPVLEVGSARPKAAWWADIRAQLGMQTEKWVGIDKRESECTDIVRDLTRQIISVGGNEAKYASCVCAETIEHVADPRVFLGSIYVLLRPGSWIVITTPFAFPVHESTGPDYWRFTPSGLTLVLTEAGFVDVRIDELEVSLFEHFDHRFDVTDRHYRDLPMWIGAVARKPE